MSSYEKENDMAYWKPLAFSAIAAAMFASTPIAPSQISINIGTPPPCPYGYFDYAPYDCAPYGYYGPDWFAGGLFVGAGPWFHGPRGFHGHVDNRYDPHHGYRGPLPGRGAEPFNHFQGNEAHDYQGHVVPHENHGGGGERALPGYRGGGGGAPHGGGGEHQGGGDHGGHH